MVYRRNRLQRLYRAVTARPAPSFEIQIFQIFQIFCEVQSKDLSESLKQRKSASHDAPNTVRARVRKHHLRQ